MSEARNGQHELQAPRVLLTDEFHHQGLCTFPASHLFYDGIRRLSSVGENNGDALLTVPLQGEQRGSGSVKYHCDAVRLYLFIGGQHIDQCFATQLNILQIEGAELV